jgi:hypothetical protein
MKKIIVHPGRAHRDDFLSTCIALSTTNEYPIIERREPTEQELDDKDILILDIGMRHEPAKRNFDHHQRSRKDSPKCALTLLIEDLNLESIFKYQNWYEVTAKIDVLGPKLTAEQMGLDKFPHQLSSPIESSLLRIFGNLESIPPDSTIYQIMDSIGHDIVTQAKKYKERIQFLLLELEKRDNTQLSIIDIGFDLRGFLVLDKEVEGLGYIRDHFYEKIDFLVAHNDRGKGWTLYRYDDNQKIDFSQIENDERIQFAHKNGFIAKTKEMISRKEIIQLLQLSRIKND